MLVPLAEVSSIIPHHRQQSDERQAAGSERVNLRCTELLRQLEPHCVKARLETLLAAASNNQGSDVAFLDRWGYDTNQKTAIAQAVEAVAD